MRFTPFITALTALAGIASGLPSVDTRAPPSNALADLVDRDDTALVSPGAIGDLSPLETRKNCVTLPKAAKLKRMTSGLSGFEEDSVIEVDGMWYVSDDSFLAANEVQAGDKVKVYNLSGCSVIFVIGTDGKPTTFHITAGKEATLAKSAATYIQAEQKSHKLTPKSILVWTREGGTTNYNEIIKAFGTDLAKMVTHEKYSYDPAKASQTERWQLVLTVGTTKVEAKEYDKAKCETGE